MSVCLNIGSGQRKFTPTESMNWLNVDCQAKWTPDHVLDMSKHDDACWFASNSADMIVLHHVLEHFGCGEADSLLKECLRILRPECPLLVFVPDMWSLSSMWREGRLDDQVFMTNVYGAYMGDEADRHKWGYTKDSLRDLLEFSGFGLVRPFNWRTIPGADIAEDSWILGMEGVK